MSLEKPWGKAFEELLEKFLQHYRGEISGSDSKGESPAWGYDTSFFFYPLFFGEWKGYTFTIEISEFPASGFSVLEAIDNIEYLRIFVTKPTSYSILIVHEDWHYRLGKKLHWDHEFQTGNKEFDSKYYLKIKSDKDRYLLTDSRLQYQIRNLEPFSALQVLASGIRWSQMITDEKQLDFMVVDNYLKKVFELTKLIPVQ